MNPLIRASRIGKTYSSRAGDVIALAQVSIQLFSGEFVAVMGPSGCGKTTLLHVLAGMERADSGEIWFKERPLHPLSEEELVAYRRAEIGFVFQFFYLLPTMTVVENVELPLQLSGRSDTRGESLRMLDRVGMLERADDYPIRLSGGEMQRVAVARAVVAGPSLVLADEPTGNLDSENGAIVLGLLRDLCRDLGSTVVMATHSAEAAQIASRRIHIRDGRIQADG